MKIEIMGEQITMKTINIVAFGAVGGAIIEKLGGYDVLLETYIMFIALDYFTGIVKAIYNKNLSSSIGFKGIAKKVLGFVLILMAVQLEKMAGLDVRKMVIIFMVVNEGISILENLSEFLPIPDQLKSILLSLRGEKNDL